MTSQDHSQSRTLNGGNISETVQDRDVVTTDQEVICDLSNRATSDDLEWPSKSFACCKPFRMWFFRIQLCSSWYNTPRAVLRDSWDSCCCGNRTEGLFEVTYTSLWLINKTKLLQICNWEWYPTAPLPSTFSEFQGYFSYPFWNATHIHSGNQWQVTDRWKCSSQTGPSC